MRRILCVAVVLPLLAVPSSSQEKKKRVPDPLMMAKLKESQTLLEGLSVNDLAKVEKSAEELLRISKTAQMRKAVNTARYEIHANNFQRSAESVLEKVKEKSIDGATLAYVEMTITCVRCHQHAREQGIGRLTPLTGIDDGIGQ